MKIKNVEDVKAWRMCHGCGVCEISCPNNAVTMVHIEDIGNRPSINKASCEKCGKCLLTCSGINNEQLKNVKIDDTWMFAQFGPFINIYEAYASDESIRFKASSGGAVTAIANYLHGAKDHRVFTIGENKKDPLLNSCKTCTSAGDIIESSGSRYSPASPCANRDYPKNFEKEKVFIGKPCDVSSMRNYHKYKNDMEQNNTVLISIFCAGTPATLGVKKLIESYGISIDDIASLRYRGNGWPGNLSVTLKNGEVKDLLPYEKAWDYIQKYRNLRCYLCADSTGETADISCGDAWHLNIKENQPGVSLIITRSQNGDSIVTEAEKAGFLTLKKVDPKIVLNAQKELMGKKSELFGRYMILKSFGIPTPRYSGWPLAILWLRSPLRTKTRSILSSVKRVFRNKLYRRLSF